MAWLARIRIALSLVFLLSRENELVQVCKAFPCRSTTFRSTVFSVPPIASPRGLYSSSSSSTESTNLQQNQEEEEERLKSLCESLNKATQACTDRIKDVKVSVRACSTAPLRLGLFADKRIKKGESVLSIPYEDDLILTPEIAMKVLDLPEKYDGWTGDLGLVAMLLLREVALAHGGTSSSSSSGRKAEVQDFMTAWVHSLPSLHEMSYHPLLWSEADQEELQSSSTKKIYRMLDDAEEDASWLMERIWSKDSSIYPPTVGAEPHKSMPCFSPQGFKWALAVAGSRSVFVDGQLRLAPLVDFANHGDVGTEEVTGGYFGRFGTTKGVQVKAGKDYQVGEQVLVSYGPKSSIEYLLEHGFLPPSTLSTAVAELTFEMDESDRFYDDKLDILEYETYSEDPMEPSQSFDVVAAPGQESEPDPAMVQFLRLVKLGGTDAFLLESIFRKQVWGFMASPVSEENEMAVVDAIVNACEGALMDMDSVSPLEKDEQVSAAKVGVGGEGGEVWLSHAESCAIVRTVERKALRRTVEYMRREREALDLKEYYQERRLKDLGLDSEWDGENPDVGWGQSRAPGGGDLDW